MKISDILKSKKATLSLEIFPPKEWDKLECAKKTVGSMLKLKPDFMSVTYGAAGTTAGFTEEISSEILSGGITALSHLTCVNSSAETLGSAIGSFKENGIENILALRGDLPKNKNEINSNEFQHANELIEFIKSKGDFCVGAACYPEKHPESKSIKEDIEFLKIKQESGADFLTTQMFFDNSVFFDFKDSCLKAGINIPIISGIMPITNIKQIGRTISLSGCTIPKEFAEIISKYGSDNAAMGKAGIDYAINQIRALILNGQKNIHIYTMNKPEITSLIMDGIGDLI